MFRGIRKMASATTGIHGKKAGKPAAAALSPAETAAKVEALGDAYRAVAAEIRAKHVDLAFLRSLGPVEVEETLGELGADSKLVRRRIAFELGLAAE